jgi:hypothetical protein
MTNRLMDQCEVDAVLIRSQKAYQCHVKQSMSRSSVPVTGAHLTPQEERILRLVSTSHHDVESILFDTPPKFRKMP